MRIEYPAPRRPPLKLFANQESSESVLCMTTPKNAFVHHGRLLSLLASDHWICTTHLYFNLRLAILLCLDLKIWQFLSTITMHGDDRIIRLLYRLRQWCHQGGACRFICTQSMHLCTHPMYDIVWFCLYYSLSQYACFTTLSQPVM